jgi:hypothetical protein
VTATLTEAVLDIPGTPKSFNAVGLHSHWSVGRNLKQKWQSNIETALMVAAVPRGLGSVLVSGRLEFPQRRRRDEGNFRTILEKACGDALVNGGWLEDDTPELYRFGGLELAAPFPRARTLLTIAWST